MKKLLVFFAMLFAVPAWGQAVWTTAGYEGADQGTTVVPTNSVSANLIDDIMRNTRWEVRLRAQPEHWWGDGGTDDWDHGGHRHGSARCFMDNDPPSVLTNAMTDYDNTVALGGGGTGTLSDTHSQVTSATDRDDVGDGRCWIDLDGADSIAGTFDDNQLYIYIGDSADADEDWFAVGIPGSPSTSTTGYDWGAVPFNPQGYNHIYNGSFEITDGDGDSGSTTVPLGWTNVDTATIGYLDPADASEGIGYSLVVTASGSATEGVSQVLNELKASTVYLVVARMKKSVGTSCNISTTGADSNMASTSVTASSMTTVTGEFETDTSLDDVTLLILTAADLDVCTIDHVGVYEKNAEPIPQPGMVVFEDSAADNTACDGNWTTCGDVVSVTVQPPGPGYIAHINASVTVETDDGTCAARVEDGSSAVAMGLLGNEHTDAFTTGTITMNRIMTEPMDPSTPITYTLDVYEEEADCSTNEQPFLHSNAINHYLQVILVPTR